MTSVQLATFALGHQQQEIDFLIPEGSHGLQDVLKPKETKYVSNHYVIMPQEYFRYNTAAPKGSND